MHKHLLITAFAAVCATVSAADATPVASLQNAVKLQGPHESVLQPVTFGYRHFYGPHYGYYNSPFFYYPYYGGSYYPYWKPRWHRHWY
jgi:hypothetical protein